MAQVCNSLNVAQIPPPCEEVEVEIFFAGTYSPSIDVWEGEAIDVWCRIKNPATMSANCDGELTVSGPESFKRLFTASNCMPGFTHHKVLDHWIPAARGSYTICFRILSQRPY